MKTLLDCQEHANLRIVQITGGRGSQLRLSQLGLGVDSTIRLKRNAPFSGPLVISFEGTDIAIGRGIAAKIRVEEVR